MAHGSQDTAGRDIANLVAKGVLVHEDAGGYSISYWFVLVSKLP